MIFVRTRIILTFVRTGIFRLGVFFCKMICGNFRDWLYLQTRNFVEMWGKVAIINALQSYIIVMKRK